ncbi:MAG TPA: hypothetical protein VI168_18455 [Croceibacterium sp.]
MLHLPESADSSLITLGTIRTPEAQSIRLRLRLQWVVRLLFGDTVYISEGWSLDGLAYLQVASEIIAAIEELREHDPGPDGLDALAPFVLERRGRRCLLETLADYLARPDCRWSGIPELAGAEDLRHRILEKINPALQLGPRGQQDAVCDAFGSLLNERLGGWLAAVIGYESLHGRNVLITPDYRQFHFYNFLKPNLLEALGKLSPDSPVEGPVREALSRLVKVTERHGADLFSSSLFHKCASDHAGDLLMGPLDHLTRLAYMHLTTGAVRASYSSPALPLEAVHTEALQRAAFGGQDAPKVHFGTSREGVEYDFRNVASQGDWKPIWRSVIQLALRREWKQAVAQFRQDTSDLLFRSTAFQTASFERMEKLLQEHCSGLVIEQTYSERLGMNLKVAKVIEVVGQAGAAGLAVSSAVAGINVSLVAVGLAGFAGFAAPTLLEKLTNESFKQWFNPLTGKKHLRSTIFNTFNP